MPYPSSLGIVYYSLFLIVFGFNAMEFFLWEPKGRGGQHAWASVPVSNSICKRLMGPGIDSKEAIPPGWESIPGLFKRFYKFGLRVFAFFIYSRLTACLYSLSFCVSSFSSSFLQSFSISSVVNLICTYL